MQKYPITPSLWSFATAFDPKKSEEHAQETKVDVGGGLQPGKEKKRKTEREYKEKTRLGEDVANS